MGVEGGKEESGDPPIKTLGPPRAPKERDIESGFGQNGKGTDSRIALSTYLRTHIVETTLGNEGEVMASWGIQIFTPLLIETTPCRINEGEEEGVICGPKRGEKMRLLPLR